MSLFNWLSKWGFKDFVLPFEKNKLDYNHWILVILWIIYYAVHSILAATSVKIFFKIKLGSYFRYYRLGYSIFVTITLVGLLYFQYSFTSIGLINSTLLKYFSVIFLLLPGMAVMMISIKKYFMLLSGIRSVFQATSAAELKVEGIHRFVRHPLYSGTILFVWGLFFIFPTLSNLIAVVLLTLYVLIGISFEEQKLRREFGGKYETYIIDVPMLIPRVKFRK